MPRVYGNHTAHQQFANPVHRRLPQHLPGGSRPVDDVTSGIDLFTPHLQPSPVHNWNCVAFGPDGMLYAGFGDGGPAADPNNEAQNLNSLLGKILRIDVDAPPPYIPSDNPFVGLPNHLAVLN